MPASWMQHLTALNEGDFEYTRLPLPSEVADQRPSTDSVAQHKDLGRDRGPRCPT